MKLAELFRKLAIPSERSSDVFNALPIPKYSASRVAVDCQGYPSLLISAEGGAKTSGLKNTRLKYLQLIQNVRCKITIRKRTSFEMFTVLTFMSSDVQLQQYFLQAADSLIRSIGKNPTGKQVTDTVDRFVEIFRALSDPPRKSVQGLWAELFVIDNASDPSTLLRFWHEQPEQKFDFDSGTEKVEVKSNSSFERVHNFSNEQLNPTDGSNVLIASVFVHPSSSGKSVADLVVQIISKLGNDAELEQKLYRLVTATLGSSMERATETLFDYDIAHQSLKYYRCEDVKRILCKDIPNEISDVRYRSDLTSVPKTKIGSIQSRGLLFAGL